MRVRLLVQGRIEYAIQHYAQEALYGQLLDAGIEIHEYEASYLHAKVAVVDDSWTTVGSSNIDPYSLLLAREANVAVYDAAFAPHLRPHSSARSSKDRTECTPRASPGGTAAPDDQLDRVRHRSLWRCRAGRRAGLLASLFASEIGLSSTEAVQKDVPTWSLALNSTSQIALY